MPHMRAFAGTSSRLSYHGRGRTRTSDTSPTSSATSSRGCGENNNDNCIVIAMPEAVRQRLLRTYSSESPPSEDELRALYGRAAGLAEDPEPFQLAPVPRAGFEIPGWLKYEDGPFEHQGKAVNAWCEARLSRRAGNGDRLRQDDHLDGLRAPIVRRAQAAADRCRRTLCAPDRTVVRGDCSVRNNASQSHNGRKRAEACQRIAEDQAAAAHRPVGCRGCRGQSRYAVYAGIPARRRNVPLRAPADCGRGTQPRAAVIYPRATGILRASPRPLGNADTPV